MKAGLEGFDIASDLARAGRAAGDTRAGQGAARGADAAGDLAVGGKAGSAGSAGGDAGAAGRGSMIAPETGRPVLPPGSGAAPNGVIAEKLRSMKFSGDTATDLSKLSPADLRRQLDMSPEEFEEFLAEAFKVPKGDPAIARYLSGQLDRERAMTALENLGSHPVNVDIAAGAGRSTEETILWHGLLDGADPKKVLEAAGITEEQGRDMFRRALIEQGVPPDRLDGIVDGFFSGREAQRLAEINEIPAKFPMKSRFTEEQIKQARIDALESMGKHAGTEDLKKTLALSDEESLALRAGDPNSSARTATLDGADFHDRTTIAGDVHTGGRTTTDPDATATLDGVDFHDRTTIAGDARTSGRTTTDPDATATLDSVNFHDRTTIANSPPGERSARDLPRTGVGTTGQPTTPRPVHDAPISDVDKFQQRWAELGVQPQPTKYDRLKYTDPVVITEHAKARGFTESEALLFNGIRNGVPTEDILRVANLTPDEAPVVLDRALTKMGFQQELRATMVERFQQGEDLVEVTTGRNVRRTGKPDVRYPGNTPVPIQNPRPALGEQKGSAFVTPEGSASGVYPPSGAGLPRD